MLDLMMCVQHSVIHIPLNFGFNTIILGDVMRKTDIEYKQTLIFIHGFIDIDLYCFEWEYFV